MTGGSGRFDAVVVGAGTAGANAAYQLARGGRSVLLVERRDATAAGAQWHNGVLAWQFERAGLEPPAPPERAATSPATHLVGPDGTRAVTVVDPPTMRADMRMLGERLRGLARDAGVEIVDRVGSLDVELAGDRIVALDLDVESSSTGIDDSRRNGSGNGNGNGGAAGGGTGSSGRRGGRRRVEADLFVDASGRRGVLRRRSPLLSRWCPEVRGDELCTASDHDVRITDPDGARRFLERHGAAPGESVTMVGLQGGFSTRSITVHPDLTEAAVLVGCLANGRYSTGPLMLAAARDTEPWLGESISGGSGVIPLRRPYARFTAPGLALVGDAACQVFPAHGSGIGIGLIAGRMLAESLDGVDDLGDEQALWGYQAAFQREWGGLLAAFDAFRRMSTLLGSEGVRRMIGAGLMTEAMTAGGLDQRWASPPPAALPAMAARLVRVPGVATRMLPMLGRGQVLGAMGARHPTTVDVPALQRWDRTVGRLLGPLPS